ncbi:MAG: hypothetical protein INQ03_17400 [Candidatus Heimdallarchaeota archaeon]|nr:hypothetical protein [Candidatus Heimdallarchaeota archaeon]
MVIYSNPAFTPATNSVIEDLIADNAPETPENTPATTSTKVHPEWPITPINQFHVDNHPVEAMYVSWI